MNGTTAFCVPWRPSPERERLFGVVLDYYRKRLCETDFIIGDSDPGEFSRAQAVNRAVDAARREGHQVVVINDADTMCDIHPLLAAVELTRQDKAPRLPYDRYILMDRSETEHFINTREVTGGTYEGACSGVLVVHTDNYTPFDERYIGWGAEDVDWAIRAKPTREKGLAWALRHTDEPREVSFPRNQKLLRDTHGQHL